LKNTKIKEEGSSAADLVTDVTDGRGKFGSGFGNGCNGFNGFNWGQEEEKGKIFSIPSLSQFSLSSNSLPLGCPSSIFFYRDAIELLCCDRSQASQSMLYSSKYPKSIFEKSIFQLK